MLCATSYDSNKLRMSYHRECQPRRLSVSCYPKSSSDAYWDGDSWVWVMSIVGGASRQGSGRKYRSQYCGQRLGLGCRHRDDGRFSFVTMRWGNIELSWVELKNEGDHFSLGTGFRKRHFPWHGFCQKMSWVELPLSWVQFTPGTG